MTPKKDDLFNTHSPRGRDAKAAFVDMSVRTALARDRAAVTAKIARLRAQRLAKDAGG